MNRNFTGEYEKVLIEAVKYEEDLEEPPAAEEEKDSLASTKEEKIPPKDFTELDRLAYIVRAIDHETAVVPRGAFKLTPEHELTRNYNSRGVTRNTATKLENF
jgi:radial spoke head protein 9